jgi:hypothetical protein
LVEKDSGWSPWPLAIEANRNDEKASFAYVSEGTARSCQSATADRR